MIERFHAKSVRGVRQEPAAAFTPITLARQFSNRCDDDINGGDEDINGGDEDGRPCALSSPIQY